MKISIIAAVAKNRVIGDGGKLPWRLSEDLRRFKKITGATPLIMGRKTFLSIGKPLPGRANIVVTKQKGLSIPGCQTANSLAAALQRAKELNPDGVFIIGGGDIYRQSLAVADVLYLTEIQKEFSGDAFFPSVDKNNWMETARVKNKGADFDFDFVIYKRKK